MRSRTAEGSRRSWLTWVGILGVVLLAIQAVRSAAVAALSERKPEFAQALWPSHPLPQTTLALAEIGAAAREGREPSAGALAMIRSAGRTDPLAVDPLLVAGTAKLAAKDAAQGERLIKAALHRDPRSAAAHFLLADLYVREQRVGEALTHVAVLGRLLRGGGAEPFAAALATYLRDPAKTAEVRDVLDRDASLRTSVMSRLAQDASATPSLRKLIRRGDADEAWFRLAFERLLAIGGVEEARALLTSAQVTGGGTGLTSWAAGKQEGPLSWRLPANSDGVAEVGTDGSLRLVYYGRNDAVLAEHLLLLPPGAYRFQARFAGALPAGSFEWRMLCLQGARNVASWPVLAPSSTHSLQVPPNCPAQRLALWGRMGEFPRTVSTALSRVALTSSGSAR